MTHPGDKEQGEAPPRRSARDARLLEAYLEGFTDVEAARVAGVSRATAQRWKRRHAEEITAAAEELEQAAIAGLRSTIGIAWRRLRRELVEGPGTTAVPAARVIFAAFDGLKRNKELEAMLVDLEEQARAATAAKAGERLRWGGSLASVTPLQPQPKKAEP